MGSKQYDKFALEYKKHETTVIKKYATGPTMFKHIRSLKKQKILDLACGAGYFTRKIKQKGASIVIGIDISKELIKLARQQEKKEKLGIKYEIIDISKMQKLGSFDKIVAGYLLHYAKTKQELQNICNNISKNLKEKGKFVTSIVNPSPKNGILTVNSKYETILTTKHPLGNGNLINVKLTKNNINFDCYYWDKGTYNTALKRAGFKKVIWHKPFISKDGLKKYGKSFWKDYLDNPCIVIAECFK